MIAVAFAAWVGVAFLVGIVVGTAIRLADALPEPSAEVAPIEEPLYVPGSWVA